MSTHRSYGRRSRTATKRNVLKRFERIDILCQQGKWNEEMGITALPKIKPS